MDARTSPLDDYLTVPQAADYLRCSESKVRALGRARQLDIVKFGGRMLVSQPSLQSLLDRIMNTSVRSDPKT